MVRVYKDKKVIIFGLARSGQAAAERLLALGTKVTITDAKKEADFNPETIRHLKELGVKFELGGHSSDILQGADLIVVSPGVPLDLPVLKTAAAPVISEIELAYHLLTKPIIAVTGTNGKTTTTTLIGEMLKADGKKVAVAGNIGAPLCGVDDSGLDFVVAEISSYQLEAIKEFKPWISVILNIQPDHLARHKTMSEYIKQKAKIFHNQTGDDFLVYNSDDRQVKDMVKEAGAKPVPFSKQDQGIITLDPQEIKIPGRHNLENALAAAAAAKLAGVSDAAISRVLKTFPGVEHRIEFVASINGVDFYNDSKATNPDSTMVAIETFKGRGLVLILGGKDKQVALDDLSAKIKANVREVILIGEAAERFGRALQHSSLHFAKTLSEAVSLAVSLARPGEVVLLSPACASFDMFKDYEERGRLFKKEVLLAKTKA